MPPKIECGYHNDRCNHSVDYEKHSATTEALVAAIHAGDNTIFDEVFSEAVSSGLIALCVEEDGGETLTDVKDVLLKEAVEANNTSAVRHILEYVDELETEGGEMFVWAARRGDREMLKLVEERIDRPCRLESCIEAASAAADAGHWELAMELAGEVMDEGGNIERDWYRAMKRNAKENGFEPSDDEEDSSSDDDASGEEMEDDASGDEIAEEMEVPARRAKRGKRGLDLEDEDDEGGEGGATSDSSEDVSRRRKKQKGKWIAAREF